jgi:glycosyltransferase involved in cell wall biosynthesis
MGRFGGLESFVLTVADGLVQFPGFSVQVVFKRAGAFSLHEDLKQRIADSSVRVAFCARASRDLWHYIKEADLVHLQNPCPDVVLLSKLARKPLLINVINHTKTRTTFHQRLWKICLQLADQRFYISDFVRRTWEKTVFPWRNSRVVFPICQLSKLQPLPFQERCGFVFVARWIENKGLDTLVEAYARSGLDPIRWPLHLLGDGPLRPIILRRIRDLGFQNTVTTPGFLTEQQKADIIRHSRFAVIPPNTLEDFGLVAIEARHLGVPCVITQDGGLPEAAGPHSLSCEPGDVDALASLLQQAASMSEEEYQNLAMAAQQSLTDVLVGPEFYADIYKNMLHLPSRTRLLT